jgi:hypothetical protein
LEQLKSAYGKEGAEKRMSTILLNLRSELLSDKFRRELVNILIEVEPKEVAFPREVKEEKAWKVSEFNRYSTAILAGFFDALQNWRQEKKKIKEGNEDA